MAVAVAAVAALPIARGLTRGRQRVASLLVRATGGGGAVAAAAAVLNAPVQVKMSDDSWLVGSKADQREFICLFDNTKLNVIEVPPPRAACWVSLRRALSCFFFFVFVFQRRRRQAAAECERLVALFFGAFWASARD